MVNFIHSKTRDQALEASKTNADGIYFAPDSLTIIHNQKEYSKTTINNLDGYFTDDNAQFNYRSTAGSQSVASQANGDLATIEALYGDSLVWNQLAHDTSFTNTIVDTEETRTMGIYYLNTSSTTVKWTGSDSGSFDNIVDNTYYSWYRTAPADANGQFIIRMIGATLHVVILRTEGTWNTGAMTDNIIPNHVYYIRLHVKTCDSTTVGGVNIDSIQVFDLSLMFGLGKEPTLAEFETFLANYFPRHDYAYNAGEILNIKSNGIKTVGFNQIDDLSRVFTKNTSNISSVTYKGNRITVDIASQGSWRLGERARDATGIGGVINDDEKRRLVKVLPNTTYKLEVSNPTQVPDCAISFIDSDFRVLHGSSSTNVFYSLQSQNGIITTTSDTAYMLLRIGNTNVTTPAGTYTTDVNLHIVWSGNRNGEYEPYWSETTPIPITTLEGTKSDGTREVMFPDGLCGIGDYKDEIKGNKAIKRIAKVDLSQFSWSLDSYTGDNFRGFVCSGLRETMENSSTTDIIRIIHSKYTATTAYNDSTVAAAPDKSISQKPNAGSLFIKDLTYTSVSTFKESLQGVYAYYVLATPIEYTLDQEFKVDYKVDDYGTEEILPENGIAPTTLPIIADIRYGINAVDTLARLHKDYVSVYPQSFNDEQKEQARKNIGIDGVATTTKDGLMSASDKTKLDNITVTSTITTSTSIPTSTAVKTYVDTQVNSYYTKKQLLAVYEEDDATMVVIDQSVSDPYSRILNPWNCPGHADFDGDENNVIKWIKDNTHRFIGKFNKNNPADGLILVPLSDENSNLLMNGSSIDNISTNATYDGQSVGNVDFTDTDYLWDYYVVKPTFYYKTVNHGDIIVLYFAKTQLDSTYHKYDGSVRALGMMKGHVNGDGSSEPYVLRSIPSVTSTNNVSQANFENYAAARGIASNARQLLVDYEEHKVMALLYYAYYGDTNCSATIGTGESTYPRTTGRTLSDGMTDSSKKNTGSINFFGIEDWWGDLYEFMSGIKTIDSNGTIQITEYHLDSSDTTRSVTNAVSDTDGSANLAIKYIFGENADILAKTVLPNEQTQSYNTYWCDAWYLRKGAGCVAYRGGSSSSSGGGVGYLILNYSPSNSYALLGSRLLYFGQIHYATLTN